MESGTHSADAAAAGPRPVSHEHPSPMMLVGTCGVLMVLLAATVLVGMFLKGPAGLVVGLGISLLKTLLIVAVFMNVMRATNLVRLAAGSALLWLALAFLLVMGDYATRGWIESGDPSLESGSNPAAYRPASGD